MGRNHHLNTFTSDTPPIRHSDYIDLPIKVDPKLTFFYDSHQFLRPLMRNGSSVGLSLPATGSVPTPIVEYVLCMWLSLDGGFAWCAKHVWVGVCLCCEGSVC